MNVFLEQVILKLIRSGGKVESRKLIKVPRQKTKIQTKNLLSSAAEPGLNCWPSVSLDHILLIIHIIVLLVVSEAVSASDLASRASIQGVKEQRKYGRFYVADLEDDVKDESIIAASSKKHVVSPQENPSITATSNQPRKVGRFIVADLDEEVREARAGLYVGQVHHHHHHPQNFLILILRLLLTGVNDGLHPDFPTGVDANVRLVPHTAPVNEASEGPTPQPRSPPLAADLAGSALSEVDQNNPAAPSVPQLSSKFSSASDLLIEASTRTPKTGRQYSYNETILSASDEHLSVRSSQTNTSSGDFARRKKRGSPSFSHRGGLLL